MIIVKINKYMSNWLTYSPASGHGNGIITITADTLSELEERTTTIVASNSQYSLSASSVVTQTYKEVSGISINNITWVNNVPWYGGVATKSNCSYNVIAHFQDGTTGDVTTIATVTGSTSVPATTASTVISAGTLELTAIYEQHTATASTTFESSGVVTIYQDSYSEPTADTTTYLTYLILEDGQIIFSERDHASTIGVEYSINNGEWISVIFKEQGQDFINVKAGDSIRFKSLITVYNNKATIYCSSRHYILGNIMSLIYGDNFSDKTVIPSEGDREYQQLSYIFSGSKVVNAAHLILPATTLSYNCYYCMFNGCTSLTKAPELPATKLADSCYCFMFENCTSLTTAPELPATTLAGSCYNGMFWGCSGLTTAPALPVTTLADYCYGNMFKNCTSLTTAPELPANTLAGGCYYEMFCGCTSLTKAPELPSETLANNCYQFMFLGCTGITSVPSDYLPATTLASECYSGMFDGCTSLTTAPDLSATTLVEYCYQYMFHGCTSLNYIKCLATDISATYCTDIWVSNVAGTGTFVKNPNMNNWTEGSSGIPKGWTVIDA